jgi:murein DD-endopeptidase MepM/ murein hydrolase activator NlpD
MPSILGAQNTISVLNSMHQVKKGETLLSIAKQYNVTEQDLLLMNPEIKKKGKLKKGTYVTIPSVRTEQTEVAVLDEKKVKEISNIKIGVILPFEEKTERAKKMVEFYQGFLMAADSVKKEGISLDIYAYSCGNKESELMQVLMKPEVATLDIIFGPVDEQQIPAAVNFCKINKIKLVLPFTNTQSIFDNPHLYIASPNYTVGTIEAAELATRAFSNKNFVILKSNNDTVKGNLFTKTLTEMLGKQGNNVRVLNIDGDDMSYESAMNQYKDNIIVPDNTSIKTLNILISKLDTFKQKHSNYNISLLGYPEWQTYTNTLLNSFFANDTYIYSSYYYNALAANTKSFEQAFTNNFKKPMSVNYPRYAMMGFDLAYYFVHDIWTNNLKSINHEPYQNMYKFVQEADNGGFCNRFIQLIHYTKTRQIELIK